MVMPGEPLSQIQLEWQVPQWLQWLEALSQRWKLVRYDGRGTGLSDREVIDFSLESQMLDLEGVVDRLALEQFDLFAPHSAGPPALAYAVRHPQRVRHLILWCTWARASNYVDSGPFKALSSLMHTDWNLFLATMAHARMGRPEGQAGADTRIYCATI